MQLLKNGQQVLEKYIDFMQIKKGSTFTSLQTVDRNIDVILILETINVFHISTIFILLNTKIIWNLYYK